MIPQRHRQTDRRTDDLRGKTSIADVTSRRFNSATRASHLSVAEYSFHVWPKANDISRHWT